MSITNSITTAAITLLLLATGTVALAQTDTATTTDAREERRAEIEAMRAERQATLEERRTIIEERRTEARAAFSEARQERITNLARIFTARLEAAIAKIESFIARITAHTETLEERGVDVSEALRLLSQAEEKIAEAKLALSGIDTDIAYVVTSDSPRNDWSEVRTQFARAKELVKEAHALLREAVGALKEAKREASNDQN